MLVTIKVSDYIYVQGLRGEVLPDGRVKVLAGKQVFCGMPV